MPNIVVYGSLQEIRAQLQAMKEVIAARNASGYPPMQHEYDFEYHTKQDGRVCPECGPLHGNHYRGDYILGDFPFYEAETDVKILAHNATVYHAAMSCRCELEWVNKHDALVQMLHRELVDAVGNVTARSFTIVSRVNGRVLGGVILER
jgi:hypothetical protein